MKLTEKLIEEYKKNPNNPKIYEIGKNIYDEIERANK